MSKKRIRPRFVVSDLGFAFAIHDTLVRQQYAFKAGADKEHASNNRLNSERVDISSTHEEAQRIADELNRRHEAGELENRDG
jgi:hypothetical protein